jgi:hypothetical protein
MTWLTWVTEQGACPGADDELETHLHMTELSVTQLNLVMPYVHDSIYNGLSATTLSNFLSSALRILWIVCFENPPR